MILHVLAQLGERLRETVRHKQRIVAKTTGTGGDKLNSSFARAGEELRTSDFGLGTWNFRQRDDATEPAGAFFQRHVLQQAQQLGVVVGVFGIFRFIQRSETRGMHAGRAVQHVHFQTGIIGENEIGR